MQRHLERLYEIEVAHRVDDFLITDPELARRLDTSATAREIDEKLLVRQDGDNLDLALYLSPQLVGRLAEDDPIEQLHNGNLVDFCTALEGVSHFLYLTWNAAFERSITRLELEMQAEVDKYVTIASLLGPQGRQDVLNRLHDWLFAEPSFDAALGEHERDRYRDANHYAAKYCLQLENCRRRAGVGGLHNELRRFYRLTLRDKIRRIESPV